jgi:hypothetical protein
MIRVPCYDPFENQILKKNLASGEEGVGELLEELVGGVGGELGGRRHAGDEGDEALVVAQHACGGGALLEAGLLLEEAHVLVEQRAARPLEPRVPAARVPPQLGRQPRPTVGQHRPQHPGHAPAPQHHLLAHFATKFRGRIFKLGLGRFASNESTIKFSELVFYIVDE